MKTVLVYGATGSQSRPVAHRLLDAGFRVRVLTRDPEKAAGLVQRGAQIAHADMADRDGLRDAHRGVDATSPRVRSAAGTRHLAPSRRSRSQGRPPR